MDPTLKQNLISEINNMTNNPEYVPQNVALQILGTNINTEFYNKNIANPNMSRLVSIHLIMKDPSLIANVPPQQQTFEEQITAIIYSSGTALQYIQIPASPYIDFMALQYDANNVKWVKNFNHWTVNLVAASGDPYLWGQIPIEYRDEYNTLYFQAKQVYQELNTSKKKTKSRPGTSTGTRKSSRAK
jgi:hypothetical protein